VHFSGEHAFIFFVCGLRGREKHADKRLYNIKRKYKYMKYWVLLSLLVISGLSQGGMNPEDCDEMKDEDF
jgi:thiosulfate reductase cytochrome b subunit